MEFRRKPILGAIAALCAALAADPAPAQEDTSLADRDVPRDGGGAADGAVMKRPPVAAGVDGAATANGGIDPTRLEGGSASLQRRAKLKALISNADKKIAGSLTSNARIAPVRPGVGTAPNAIGVVVPGVRTPGHDVPGSAAQTGTRLRGIAMPVPTNAGPSLHGAGLNGTTMRRIDSGPASVGGPAKDRSGINGTSIRPKH